MAMLSPYGTLTARMGLYGRDYILDPRDARNAQYNLRFVIKSGRGAFISMGFGDLRGRSTLGSETPAQRHECSPQGPHFAAVFS